TAGQIGRYRILRQLGSGGMGEVYLAEDPKLQRNVALKIVSDPDEKAKRRFVREAVTASQLSHPNVAVVYEAGETDDGTAFIAMQYVEGAIYRPRRRFCNPAAIRAISMPAANLACRRRRTSAVKQELRPPRVERRLVVAPVDWRVVADRVERGRIAEEPLELVDRKIVRIKMIYYRSYFYAHRDRP